MDHVYKPEVVLQSIPVIIQKILSPLPVKTLNTCARVCSTWNDFVKKIKASRKEINWSYYECPEEEDGNNMIEHTKQILDSVSSQPEYVFLFCTSLLLEKPVRLPSRHPSRHPRNAKCEVLEIGDCFKTLLPKSCSLYALAVDGVVGTSRDLKTIREMEQAKALSYLLLPKLQGFCVYDFTMDIFMNRMDDASQVFDTSCVSHIPTEEVKLVLMFSNESFCPPEISYGIFAHFPQAVVAGGFVDDLISLGNSCSRDHVNESLSASLLCLAFAGSNIHVRSVIIKEEVHEKKVVEEKIKSLKDCQMPEDHSFAFMFACIGRGQVLYKEENVESRVFRKFFPKTPLFGFFGNGEIGFNLLEKYVPASGEEENGTRKSSRNVIRPKLHHAYTSVIVFVSIIK